MGKFCIICHLFSSFVWHCRKIKRLLEYSLYPYG